MADNNACFVCHANFRKEELASSHAANGVGCVSCHGRSTNHRNDEANVIPPDIMFPTETLDASCARCHEGHDVEPRRVVERFLAKTSGRMELKSLVCTNCHGEHHLAVRTVRWDKKIGKLVAGRPK
jgi:formate-dependent nitrite reductase cytochrome c552 subunit